MRGESIKGLWNRLFSKDLKPQEIRVQLKEIEREQRKKRRELEIKEGEKSDKIKEAVTAKKAGKQELLRDVFRELRQMEIDNGYISKDLHRLSLCKTAFTRLLRQAEMLEREKDWKSYQKLIARFMEGPIQQAIDKGEVEEEVFEGMLVDILGEEELAVTGKRVQEDRGFAEFDKAIEEMARAEESGSEEEDFSRLQKEIDRAIKAEKIRDQ